MYGGTVEIRTPDPPLSDGAVTLRPWTLDDVAAIARACNEREIARWIHQMPSPYGEQDAHEYVLATQAGWREGTGGSSQSSTRRPPNRLGRSRFT